MKIEIVPRRTILDQEYLRAIPRMNLRARHYTGFRDELRPDHQGVEQRKEERGHTANHEQPPGKGRAGRFILLRFGSAL